MAALPALDLTSRTHEIATAIERALRAGGKVRAAGAMDTLIAECAVEHDAVLIHYDG